MSKTTRRRFTAAFKTKVCMEDLKERDTVKAFAKKYDIHQNQINTWKREFITKSETVFEKPSDPARESKDKLIEALYSRIGELNVANEFLKNCSKSPDRS